jgi:hypothetical protein
VGHFHYRCFSKRNYHNRSAGIVFCPCS